MADSKITALTALTAADPVNDMFPIVDVSDTTMAASGTTKKISVNNILGASGTATLASATITGDLTVRTNKLAVTSAGVGFGTTTPAYPAHFRTTSPIIAIQDDTSAATGVGGTMNFLGFTSGTSGANVFAQIKGVKTASSAGGEYQVFTSDSVGNSVQRYLIDSTGISTWSVAGTTAMTLNATGLGIGASPSYKLHVAGANPTAAINSTTASISSIATLLYRNVDGNSATQSVASIAGETAGNGGYGNLIFSTGFNGSLVERMRIDLSGNLILQSSATPATLGTNGMLTVNATSNTNLRFSYRGSDGTTRVANITLA